MGELRGRTLVAYLIVCIVWGATFLAMRIGVETIPPFLLAGIRFFVAGVLLLGGALLFGGKLPASRRDWTTLSIVGILLLASGNGVVVWATQYVDSGSTAIYLVTVAIWAACFDALIKGGTTPFTWKILAGLVAGLVGTAILTGATPATMLHTDFRGPLALVMASASWAAGTVYLKRHPVAVGASMTAALQMSIGGGALFVIAASRGEMANWHPATRSLVALACLIVFGSILGYTAYAYALKHASATVVGTYAYVNPVVAVILGWSFMHEALDLRKVLAMGIILGAVVWIQRSVRR